MLLLALAVIPSSGKNTVATNGINVQVGKQKAASPKKKEALSFCDDDTCNTSFNAKDDNKSKAACVDKHADCAQRAKKGECDTNSDFMLKECKESCFVCGENG